MKKNNGYRGYIGSREYNNYFAPHHVQNLVIRDYCKRNNLDYFLSVTEYTMHGSYVMLEEIMRELSNLDGIVMHSIFMLPEERSYRQKIYKNVFDQKASIHGALENISINDLESSQKVEDIIEINRLMKKKDSVQKLNLDPKVRKGNWEWL